MSKERLVIIAVDRSEQALHAFNYYADRLHRPENHIIILHCPELPDSVFKHIRKRHTHPKHDDNHHENIANEMELEKQKWLLVQEKYEKLLQERKMKGEFVCAPHHRAGEGIVRECTERKATMIVMGTRGLGAVRRTIMGSVSDYVVHHVHCPVIVCRK